MINRPTISFELAPPRRPNSAPRFWAAARRLLSLYPDFISVTYGAGGAGRGTARAVLARLLRDRPVLPIAHLTVVGASREDVGEVIGEFLDSGVRAFLALRGDPPRHQPDWQPEPGGLTSAVDLIHLLHEVEDRRRHDDPGQALREAVHPLSIGVAAFPSGNAASGTTRAQEVERLVQKAQAGADFAITQFFYDADEYLAFVAAVRSAGVEIPIVPGILPVTSAAQLGSLAGLAGVVPPPELVAGLDRYARAADQYNYGIEYMAGVAEEVLAGGAPGLHVYTFNKAAPAIQLLENVRHNGIATRLSRAFPTEY